MNVANTPAVGEAKDRNKVKTRKKYMEKGKICIPGSSCSAKSNYPAEEESFLLCCLQSELDPLLETPVIDDCSNQT